jgi:hypothetical protein
LSGNQSPQQKDKRGSRKTKTRNRSRSQGSNEKATAVQNTPDQQQSWFRFCEVIEKESAWTITTGWTVGDDEVTTARSALGGA